MRAVDIYIGRMHHLELLDGGPDLGFDAGVVTVVASRLILARQPDGDVIFLSVEFDILDS